MQTEKFAKGPGEQEKGREGEASSREPGGGAPLRRRERLKG